MYKQYQPKNKITKFINKKLKEARCKNFNYDNNFNNSFWM